MYPFERGSRCVTCELLSSSPAITRLLTIHLYSARLTRAARKTWFFFRGLPVGLIPACDAGGLPVESPCGWTRIGRMTSPWRLWVLVTSTDFTIEGDESWRFAIRSTRIRSTLPMGRSQLSFLPSSLFF